MNRLDAKIQQVRKEKTKLFCAFLTLGYPSVSSTEKLIVEFEKERVDIIELGFPFSDPLADGPTIQYSSEQALKKEITFDKAFSLVARLRKKGVQLPILTFTYFNPVFQYGFRPFVHKAHKAGIDGVIIPDLPPHEERKLEEEVRRARLDQVFLIAPTTESKRASQIAKASQGFIYYVSLRGVTGARRGDPAGRPYAEIKNKIRQIKRQAKKPVLVGFGVSSPEQVKSLCKISDGVIVGSAIVDAIRQAPAELRPAVLLVRKLVRAAKGSSVSFPRKRESMDNGSPLSRG